MTFNEREDLVNSFKSALCSSEGNDRVVVNVPRKSLESLVSTLERIDILKCSKIICDEDFLNYPRGYLEEFIKDDIRHCFVEKIIESECVTYKTEKDHALQQTHITASVSIIKPEVEK